MAAIPVNAAVEGLLDEAVVRQLLNYLDLPVGSVYGRTGKPDLHQKLQGYNEAARHSPWLALADLDHDFDCAPLLVAAWLAITFYSRGHGATLCERTQSRPRLHLASH